MSTDNLTMKEDNTIETGTDTPVIEIIATSLPTDTRSEIEKLYDRAYKHGVASAIRICELCVELNQPLTYVIKKLKELTNEPSTSSNPIPANDPS